jgi:8-oxo-dGTP diphosphatase
MATIVVLKEAEIDASLHGATRQYLVGNLTIPQVLKHIHSDLLEVGVTRYANSSREPTHTHRQAFEFQYVLSGVTAYLDVRSGREWVFEAGDFYMIEPGVVYAQKAEAGTAILFFKVPPGNDKVPVAETAETEAWFKAPITGNS